MNRIAISNIAWPGDADDEALALVAATGYSGLEIAPVKVFGPLEQAAAEPVRDYARRVSDLGLPIVAMQAILFGAQGVALFGSDEERSALRQALGEVARVAGLLGGLPCVFGAPKIRDVGVRETGEAFDIAVEFFRQLAPLFADQGSTLCFEANPAIYDCNFATYTHEAIALVEAVGAPGFSLQFDVGTVIQNAEPAWVIEKAAGMASHFHVSQPHLAPLSLSADHERVAAISSKTGYLAAISVEMKASSDWQASVRESFNVAASYRSQR